LHKLGKTSKIKLLHNTEISMFELEYALNQKQNNDVSIYVGNIKPSTSLSELIERFKASDAVLYGLNEDNKNEGLAKIIYKSKSDALEFLSSNLKILKKKK